MKNQDNCDDPHVNSRPVVAVYPDGSVSSTVWSGTKSGITKQFVSPGFASSVLFDDEAVAVAPWLEVYLPKQKDQIADHLGAEYAEQHESA